MMCRSILCVLAGGFVKKVEKLNKYNYKIIKHYFIGISFCFAYKILLVSDMYEISSDFSVTRLLSAD